MHKKIGKVFSALSRMIAYILALVLTLALVPVTATAYTASDWAKPEIEKAQSYGLIPDALKDADLTKPITRAEFAAIAIKTYENFTGTTVTPVATNPFVDTNDPNVLKAYSINIVNGTTATTYTPNGVLSREQAATMLTRVEKKVYIPGWTLAADNSYTLNFTQPAKFADDNKISEYAKTSVYFMNVKGVINGTGNNMFSPAVTATRQEALIIAVRMVDKLKGVTLDYTQGGTTTPPTTTEPTHPTQPPSGTGNSQIIGRWSYSSVSSWLGSGETWIDINTTVYSGTNFSDFEGWEFKSDGTFYNYYMTTGSQTAAHLNGISFYRGNYSINGDEITFTNVEEKWLNFLSSSTSQSDSFDWKAISSFSIIIMHGFDIEGRLGIGGVIITRPKWFYPV